MFHLFFLKKKKKKREKLKNLGKCPNTAKKKNSVPVKVWRKYLDLGL